MRAHPAGRRRPLPMEHPGQCSALHSSEPRSLRAHAPPRGSELHQDQQLIPKVRTFGGFVGRVVAGLAISRARQPAALATNSFGEGWVDVVVCIGVLEHYQPRYGGMRRTSTAYAKVLTATPTATSRRSAARGSLPFHRHDAEALRRVAALEIRRRRVTGSHLMPSLVTRVEPRVVSVGARVVSVVPRRKWG